ncbi:BQ5605_C001g00040 [Microbotryum silenes-dioicae]|uniref:BQ5605_C001g00040 protein n=1 Tax=Microbotryum silenes-dioicae TaxID=796604 RepID=A0A2X0M249_9BASI|nr:BQ5605_C001g00040 [Microbotryum silenes-dioicae]
MQSRGSAASKFKDGGPDTTPPSMRPPRSHRWPIRSWVRAVGRPKCRTKPRPNT